MSEDPRLLTVTEAGQAAGVSRATITGWIQGGQLPCRMIGRRRVIHPADLASTQARAHLGSVVPAWRAEPGRVGARLRALREGRGWNQQQLAAASGLTHEEVSRLEHGQKAPFPTTIRALAQAFDVAPEWFVSAAPVGLTTLSTAEAAARLGVPAERLRTWVQRGDLAGMKVSGRWRVLAVAVMELGRSGRLRGASRRLDPRYRG